LCDGAEAGVNSGSVTEEKWDLCTCAEAGVRSCALSGCPHKHFNARDVSYLMKGITFVSYFISSFQRHIRPLMKLETAKRKPKFREERKNVTIIFRNYLPHHKKPASS
jgi:hypothetical protein